MTAYAIVKNNNELIALFRSKESAHDQLYTLPSKNINKDVYSLKEIDLFGKDVKNSIVYSIFKESTNKECDYFGTFSSRKDAENKIKSLNKDAVYIDLYYIEEHPIFD